MILIWHRPYWEQPIFQEEIRSVELKQRLIMRQEYHRDYLVTTMVAEIVHLDGERERINLETTEHLILMVDDRNSNMFKVLL